jgi:hypothetical protein
MKEIYLVWGRFKPGEKMLYSFPAPRRVIALPGVRLAPGGVPKT